MKTIKKIPIWTLLFISMGALGIFLGLPLLQGEETTPEDEISFFQEADTSITIHMPEGTLKTGLGGTVWKSEKFAGDYYSKAPSFMQIDSNPALAPVMP